MYKICDVLNDIYMILVENHTMNQASVLVHPLVWYYATGRMTYEQEAALKRLDNRQERIVAKKLARGGSDYEAAGRVMSYLNKFKAA